MPSKDMTGKKFGMLTVEARHGTKSGKATWSCICECGKSTIVTGDRLRQGKTKSCGCIRVQRIANLRKTHGKSKLPEFHSWNAMIQRCQNPNNPGFKEYGAKGVKVCQRWQYFEAFLEDMGSRPSAAHSIDRKDGSKGYSPENCRWATPIEQASNTKTNRYIEHNGETHTLSEWARKTGIHKSTIKGRLDRGWDVERALGH